MPQRIRNITLTGILVMAAVLLANIQASSAQSTGPNIVAINISSITSNSATVSYTTSTATTARVVYDTSSHAQAADYAFATDFTGIAATSNQVFLTGIPQPSTTYHYRLEVKDGSGTTDSADRTFATTSATGGSNSGTGLLITGISYSCVGIQCRISYSTNFNATVQIRWDTAFHDTFGAYPFSSSETTSANGPRSLLVPAANGSPLQFNTTYHYRIQATGSGAPDLTNDLTLTTGAANGDHTFSTGTCPDGTIIGACNANRQFCASGGNLVTSCTSICGLTCGTGQTCNNSGQCVADPSLNGSPYQCNQTNCYDNGGQFISPGLAGCYSSWPKCNANTVLKVQKDRGCNLWLTCATSLQTEPSAIAPAENLCLSLAACNSLGLEGQCNKYLPQGQCSNDPLRFCSSDLDCTAGGTCNVSPGDQPTQSLQDVTFQTPEDVSKIADLSGNIVAGLDWHQLGGSNVISGMLPWQLMRQVGGNAQLKNGDFEYNPPDTNPWTIAPPAPANPGNTSIKIDFEDRDNSINHVLIVNPDVAYDSATAKHCQLTKSGTNPTDCSAAAGGPGNCTVANDSCVADQLPVNFSGALSSAFLATPNEYYYAEARIKAPTGTPRLRVQFGFNGYTQFAVGTTPTFVDVTATNAWQRVTLGPIKGMSGLTQLGVVCSDTNTSDCSSFWLDDVQVRPVLQSDTNPTYITPSCRLYPKEDSPACDYVDQNNVIYKGWHGYCLEHDSQTGTCLSWWPVDIIKGESNVFGNDVVAGYQDRAPLFMCAESQGYATGATYVNGATISNYAVGLTGHYQVSRDCCDGSDASAIFNHSSDPGILWGGNTTFDGFVAANAADSKINQNDLYGMRMNSNEMKGGFGLGSPLFITQTSNGLESSCHGWFKDTPWSVCYSSNEGNGSTDNLEEWVAIHFDFDAADGHFRGVEIHGDDGGSKGGSGYVNVQLVLKEQCTKLVQVVTPDGRNAGFAQRLNSPSYSVPDLGYTSVSDVSPYGAVLQPANVSNDPTQWAASLPAEQPDYTNFQAPGQARSGNPYACAGNCGSSVVCSIDGSSCLTNGAVDSTKVKNCQIKDGNGDGAPDGVCIGLNNIAPSAKTSQLFDPTLDPTAVATGGALCSAPKAATCSATQTVSTTTFGGVTAIAAAQNFLNTKCLGLVACDGTNGSCAGGTAVKFTGSTAFSCTGLNVVMLHTCTATCTIPAGTPYTTVATQVSSAYYAEQHIRRLFTQSFGIYDFNQSNHTYSLDSGLSIGDVTKTCPIDNATGQIKRPDYPNDYCSVPPTVSNTSFLNSPAKVATITSGSGSIGLKFNSNADSEQVPLNIIKIDWGDSQDSFSYPFAPRNDPAKPHIFSHAYVYNSGNSSGCTTAACTTKTYHIRIQVQDNWGWCSDTKTDGTSVKNCSTNVSSWFDTGLSVNITK